MGQTHSYNLGCMANLKSYLETYVSGSTFLTIISSEKNTRLHHICKTVSKKMMLILFYNLLEKSKIKLQLLELFSYSSYLTDVK